MSNGGYKGSTPARETSPEQYPGVWELTEQFQAQADGNWPFQAADCAPKSLRFNGSSSYLSRTPAAAGNRKTWTWSGWVKRANLGDQNLFDCSSGYNASPSNYTYGLFRFNGSNQLGLGAANGGPYTTAFFRDVGAWYHIVLAFDTTQATPVDRCKIYVNGIQQSLTAYTFDHNGDYAFNLATEHDIGKHYHSGGVLYLDALLADVYFIDGQALTPDAFTFIDGQGVLQPKRFTGDYSSGPVYSNFITASNGGFHAAPYHQPAGFNNVIGTGSAGYVQAASGSNPNNLTFTPPSGIPYTNSVEVYIINAANTVTVNGGSAQTISANQWVTVASGSGVLTSLKFERPSTSGASFSGIKIDGQLLQDASVGRNSFQLDFSNGVKDQSGLANDWTANNLVTNYTPPASTSHRYWKIVTNNGISHFPRVSKLYLYESNGTRQTHKNFTGDNCSDSGTIPSAGTEYPADYTNSYNFTNVGIYSVYNGGNRGGTAQVYYSDNNSDWTFSFTAGITTNSNCGEITGTQDGPEDVDVSVDSPVNGNEASTGAGGERRGCYCTYNPLDKHSSAALSEGNLKVKASTTAWQLARSTFFFSSGKHYWEFTWTGGVTSSSGYQMGLKTPESTLSAAAQQAGSYAFQYTSIYQTAGSLNTVTVSPGSTTSGDTVMFAYDADAGKMWLGVNGTWNGSGNPATGANPDWTNLPTTGLSPFAGCYGSGNTITLNAGQRAFKYTNHAGFSPLATSFLPEPTIKRGDEAMDVALWTGNGVSQTISGLLFSPDLIWGKSRSSSNSHWIMDTVRGAGKRIIPNSTGTEDTKTDILSAINSNGFTIGNNTESNTQSNLYAAWTWDAGEATTTIAAGGLNSSAYDFSQNFSGNVSNPNGQYGAASNAFNGSLSNHASPSTGNEMTYTNPSASSYVISTFEIYIHIYASNVIVELNGTNIVSQLTTTQGWYTITGFTGQQFSTLKWGPNTSNLEAQLHAVRVNGKILVDTGVSVANVPSVASTVRANPSAGFSIVTATPGQNATIAHGLINAAPEFIINKSRTVGYDWTVYHKDLGVNDFIRLTPAAKQTASGYWGSEVTSTVFGVGSGSSSNNSGNQVFYCFTGVEGYSKFSSFQNPSGDGAFVFCGFKPKLIIAKCAKNISSSSGSGDWMIYDTSRLPFNNPADNNHLVANVANAEDGYYSSGQGAIDILSNGFKIRHPGSSPLGDPGRLYIFAAWAEVPFASQARAR